MYKLANPQAHQFAGRDVLVRSGLAESPRETMLTARFKVRNNNKTKILTLMTGSLYVRPLYRPPLPAGPGHCLCRFRCLERTTSTFRAVTGEDTVHSPTEIFAFRPSDMCFSARHYRRGRPTRSMFKSTAALLRRGCDGRCPEKRNIQSEKHKILHDITPHLSPLRVLRVNDSSLRNRFHVWRTVHLHLLYVRSAAALLLLCCYSAAFNM
jgi:hypothetical protein